MRRWRGKATTAWSSAKCTRSKPISQRNTSRAIDSSPHLPVSRPEFVLRVYRADPTPIESDETREHNYYLKPPANEKNFLISPPGSPPVGWEQLREDPPNSTPLAHDLIAALRKLEVQEESARRGPGIEVLLEPEDGVGISVCVEDCDAVVQVDGVDMDADEDWAYGELAPSRMRFRPTPTAMPPIAVTV